MNSAAAGTAAERDESPTGPLRVSLVSTFGPNVRGLSPYSDGLAGGLDRLPEVALRRVDYERVYPSFLYPAAALRNADNEFARLHYARPGTWSAPLESDPDVVHLQYWTPINAHVQLGIARRARRRGVRTILTVHNAKPHETMPLLKPFEQALLKGVDHVVVHTEGGRESLLATGTKSADEISVVPLGVTIDETSFAPATPDDFAVADLNPEHRHVLFFGNIRHYKGVDILIDAWRRVASRHPDARLVVAGRVWEGGNWLARAAGRLLNAHAIGREIRDLAERHEPPGTIYRIGFVEDDVLSALCRIAELGVFPYRSFDAQSAAATTVGSHGTPIVVSDRGGLASLVIDESYVCNPLTAEEVANVIDRHLTARDPNAPARQRHVLERFNWPHVADRHASLYREVVGASRAERSDRNKGVPREAVSCTS